MTLLFLFQLLFQDQKEEEDLTDTWPREDRTGGQLP